MSTPHRHKETHRKSGRHSPNNDEDGTSARTRPLSYDDIMLKRKRKSLSENINEGVAETEIVSRKGDFKNDLSQTVESERGHRPPKDSLPTDERRVTEKKRRVSSPKDSLSTDERRVTKKERHVSSAKEKIPNAENSLEENHHRDKVREIPKLVRKLKSVISRPSDDLNDEVKEGKIEKQLHDKRENEKRLVDHARCEAGKRQSRDLRGKESRVERGGRISERDSKRKFQNDGRDKNKDRDSSKKHDTGKHHETQIPERNKRKDQKESSDKNKDRDSLKKPEIEKHYETQISERNKRKELSKHRVKEPEPKVRRRSRSRDRDDRHKRSKSPLTRVHKRLSHNKTAHKEVSPHTHKDKPQRENHMDGNKLPSNGSGGHYRRHEDGKSGLGGYSPRKRISEAAAKTPPPPDHSLSEKKSAKWDILPQGINKTISNSVVPTFQSSNSILSTVTQELANNTARIFSTYAKLPSSVLATPFQTKTFSTVDSIQLTQSTRPMRRLYVDNIPASTTEKDLVKWLNDLFLSSGVNQIPGTQPCIDCTINKEKGQALVEFLTPEDALTALSFDGKSISGSVLKIRRPKDFVEVATGNLEKTEAVVDTLSDVVKDSPNKIFIGGISKALSSKLLMEIVSAFGALKAYHFEVNGDLDEPCAFLEYTDQSVTLKACAGLNGMKIGGKVLTVVQALHGVETSAESTKLYDVPQHAKPLLKQPTQVLKLKNVFNVEDLLTLSEPEVEEVLEDIRLECSRFGNVKSVNVVKDCARDLNGDVEINFDQNLELCMNGESDEIESEKFMGNAKELQEDEVEKDVSTVDDKPDSTDGESAQPSQPKINVSIEVLKSETDPSPVLEENTNQPNCPKQEQHNDKSDFVDPLKANPKENQSHEQDIQVHDLDMEKVFEIGCVFVEFGRTEAACSAAHSLHGRVFDSKTVLVEYVTLDRYKSRFSK